MGIRLTGKELDKLWVEYEQSDPQQVTDFGIVVAKAQLKKVHGWGDEPCPHGYLAPDTSKANKHECPECWQALLKEV